MSVELGAALRPVFMKGPLEFIRLVHRRYLGVFRSGMRFPTYSEKTARLVLNSADRVRYGTLALALQTIERERVSGDLAELGVWRGATSTFLHSQMPQRILYLFDTFTGFPGESDADGRFRDTSVDAVRRRIGDNSNVIFRVGTFPGTTSRPRSSASCCRPSPSSPRSASSCSSSSGCAGRSRGSSTTS